MTNAVYRTQAWQHARAAVLTRDMCLCQLKLRGCTRTATEVDHVVPISQGGAPYALTNLRAACKACNISARNTNIAARAKRTSASREW